MTVFGLFGRIKIAQVCLGQPSNSAALRQVCGVSSGAALLVSTVLVPLRPLAPFVAWMSTGEHLHRICVAENRNRGNLINSNFITVIFHYDSMRICHGPYTAVYLYTFCQCYDLRVRGGVGQFGRGLYNTPEALRARQEQQVWDRDRGRWASRR